MLKKHLKKPFRVSKNVEKCSIFVQYHNKKIMQFLRYFFEVKFCPIFWSLFFISAASKKKQRRGLKELRTSVLRLSRSTCKPGKPLRVPKLPHNSFRVYLSEKMSSKALCASLMVFCFSCCCCTNLIRLCSCLVL